MRARILNLTDTKNFLVRSYKPQSDGVIKFFCVLEGLCSPGGHSIVIGGLVRYFGVWDFGWEKIFWSSSKILIWTLVRGGG